MVNKLENLLGWSLYWGHIIVVVILMVSGFFLPLAIVVGLYLLTELLLIVYHGCPITKLQQKTGSLDDGQDFIPLLTERYFNLKLSGLQHELLSFAIMIFPVLAAIIRQYT